VWVLARQLQSELDSLEEGVEFVVARSGLADQHQIAEQSLSYLVGLELYFLVG
jgi:hypothetical protein